MNTYKIIGILAVMILLIGSIYASMVFLVLNLNNPYSLFYINPNAQRNIAQLVLLISVVVLAFILIWKR